jgi:hypothetical protein
MKERQVLHEETLEDAGGAHARAGRRSRNGWRWHLAHRRGCGLHAEVFYANGYYWSRRDQSWYRAHDHKGSWARVDSRNVPVVIRDSPPGRYKNYKGEKHEKEKDHRDGNGHGSGNGKGHGDGHS